MKIFLFGANREGRMAIDYFSGIGLDDSIIGFIDNSTRWQGESSYYIEDIPVYSPFEKAKALLNDDALVIIMTCMDNGIRIAKQLRDNGIIKYFFWEYLKNKDEKLVIDLIKKNNPYEVLSLSLQFENDVRQHQVRFLTEHIDPSAFEKAIGKDREKQLEMIKLGEDIMEIAMGLSIKPFLICGNLLGYVRHDGFIPWDDDLDFGLVREEYERLIDHCKTKNFLYEYSGEYNWNKIYDWVNNVLKDHSNEICFFLTPMRFRVIKSGGDIDWTECPRIDIDPFDEYSGDYSFQEHNKFLESIGRDIVSKKYCLEQNELIDRAKQEDKRFQEEGGKYLYTGIDCWDTFFNGTNKTWYCREDVLPLKKVIFEGKEFYAPNYPEKCLEARYGIDYMKIPETVALHLHKDMEEKLR